jgi:hypothetical protein
VFLPTTTSTKQLAFGKFLDLSYAFHVIDHDLLLTKLELYGLRGISDEWMRSYLTDRLQFVEIHHTNNKLHGLSPGGNDILLSAK